MEDYDYSNDTDLSFNVSFYYDLPDEVFYEVFGDAVLVSLKCFLNNLQIGIIHLVISSSFMILQLLVFSSFYNNKTIFKNTCFKIIFNHGILSLIQQICHIITSIITILENEKINVVLPIIGVILTSSYLGSIAFIFLLTLNRFDIVYNIHYLHKKEKEKFYLIGIILCYIFTIVIFVAYTLIPECKITFSFVTYEWVYDVNQPNMLPHQFEKYSTLTFLVLSLILQFLIFLKIFLLRCSTSRRKIFVPDDFKIILHGFLCFVTALLLELIWDGMLFQIYWSGVLIIMPHILHIFCSVSNSIFSLCFVREIRKNMIIYKYFKKKFTNVGQLKSMKTVNATKFIRTVA
ncbi:7TM GPCR, serpentine receptor class x (Srx) family-containing protein [Strongyloides ratti]|uniref:7TM GPCR, serpentine receptor class x (Srx) family-containing protein n=1 Tax=Strongyloides ratti TaxID=34506 RepID=A0A090MX81_STRRB|nr:7TM GPCR, serpentine receptor class x (Srx) family-containing protein [Strongyloides ratti]CEF64974.1 7TM GPCR, serpentine receptor class x (Srx) family-containing protein [Strongyloides ratti]